jgi:hypothetical protein
MRSFFAPSRVLTLLFLLSAVAAAAQTGTNVSFDRSAYTVSENGGSLTVNVVRTGPLGGTTSVNYSAEAFTFNPPKAPASAYTDFSPVSGTLSFAPNEYLKTFTIPISNDAAYEPEEGFYVFLRNCSGCTGSYYYEQAAVVTITDDDPPSYLSVPQAISVGEGVGVAHIPITRTGDLSQPVSFSYLVSSWTAIANSDFTVPSPSPITIPAGVASTTIDIPIIQDSVYEGDEMFTVNLSSPSGAAFTGSGNATITIVDDDPVVTVDFSSTTYSASESAGSKTIAVTRSGDLSGVSLVHYSSQPGYPTRSVAVSGTLIFAAGDVTRTFDVPIVDNLRHEFNETVTLTLTLPNDAVVGSGTATLTIVDDDPLTTVTMPSNLIAAENTNAVIPVTRDYAGLPLTINYRVLGDSVPIARDFSAPSGTVTFAAGESTKNINLPLIDNSVFDGDRSYLIAYTLPDSNGPSINLVNPYTALTVRDDEGTPSVSFQQASYNVGESAGNAVVNIARTGSLLVPVTLTYATQGSTATGSNSGLQLADYQDVSGSVTFAAGESLKSISVPIINDAIVEQSESFTIRVSLGNRELDRTTVNIIDDDTGPQITLNDVVVSEGNSGTTAAVFVLNLSKPATSEIVLNYHINPATAGAAVTTQYGYVSIAAGETQKTISIPFNANTLPQENRQFFLTIDTNAFGYSGSCYVSPTAAAPNPCGGAYVTKSLASATIVDDDSGVSVADVSVAEGNSGTSSAIFSVKLNFARTTPVTVDYETVNGSASADSDYVGTSGTLTFAPGETEKQVLVTINGDTEAEGDERFSLRLSNAANTAIVRGTALGIIVNDDLPYTLLPDLEYANVAGQSLTLDLYTPADPQTSVPLILWIHGDHWSEGNKFDSPAIRETSRGYAVASLEFRSSADAYFPAQINDLKAAVRWLRANAERFHLDSARFGAWGFGSGGHLASLLGTSGDVDKLDDPNEGNPSISSRVMAVVDQAGPIDLMGMQDDALACSTTNHNSSGSYESLMLGCNLQYCYDKARMADPTAWISSDDGAFLLLYGDSDCEVGPGQGQSFYRALHNAHLDATISIGRNVAHNGQWWDSNDVRSQIDAFFDAKLKNAVIPHRRTTQH